MTARFNPCLVTLEQAIHLLRQDRVVALPTETVYGVAGNALCERAIDAIYNIKRRPPINPLIVHVKDVLHAAEFGNFTAPAKMLAEAFWPGPITLIVPISPQASLPVTATAGLPTVALRCPQHPIFQHILQHIAFPLAAPSANLSGQVTCTTPNHIIAQFGESLPILSDGQTLLGIESTVVDCTGDIPMILRPGIITAEMIHDKFGACDVHKAKPQDSSSPKSPGLLLRHYAPKKPLRLNVNGVGSQEALLAFGPTVPAGGCHTLNLSPEGDLLEAARNLYHYLLRLDNTAAISIAVMPIPATGIGYALNDRLQRAAASSG